MKTENTYDIKLYCKNCGAGGLEGFYREVEKGITIPKYLNTAICPNCGCTTLKTK